MLRRRRRIRQRRTGEFLWLVLGRELLSGTETYPTRREGSSGYGRVLPQSKLQPWSWFQEALFMLIDPFEARKIDVCLNRLVKGRPAPISSHEILPNSFAYLCGAHLFTLFCPVSLLVGCTQAPKRIPLGFGLRSSNVVGFESVETRRLFGPNGCFDMAGSCLDLWF